MGKYKIQVGDERPLFVNGQSIEKNSGQTILAQGGQTAVYAVQTGVSIFSNKTEAWGIRLDKGGKIPKEQINVTDADYDGKVKFTEWGKEGGCLIVSRYLNGYNTLDEQYQKLRLRADDKIDDRSDVWTITLPNGLNEFDEKTQGLLIEHLKIHQYNRDSVSKAPDSFHSLFFETSEELELKEETKTIDAKTDALLIVKMASKDVSLKQLYNVKKAVSILLTEDATDENIYSLLLKAADKNPELFLSNITEYKKEISNLFVKAEAYKLLDLSKDGIIAAGKDSKEVIGNNIPAKGKKMLDYLLENCFEEESSKTILLLKDITDKIK